MAIEDKARQGLSELLTDGATIEELYQQMRAGFENECVATEDEAALRELRDRWLGRKNGIVSAANDNWLKQAPRELKPKVGKLQNVTKKSIEGMLADAAERIAAAPAKVDLLDVTLPGPPRQLGARHPIRIVQQDMIHIFRSMGFSIAEGPEIESFRNNFTALNFPEDHPAVDEMDTFFIEDSYLLRTHTSPAQIRIMESAEPPLRYISTGKVYRHDSPDSTHSPMFHQMEGFAVGEDISLAHLKGTLDFFLKRFFGPQTETRFRPSFFPFTEPSAEVDVTCPFCAGRGCRICKQTGWIEVLGCGMIDPEVFRHVGYDPEKYTGFAFGMGVDRFAMLKYDINDIQLLFQGDVRFLRQFE